MINQAIYRKNKVFLNGFELRGCVESPPKYSKHQPHWDRHKNAGGGCVAAKVVCLS
jgi:hypothetical protein